MQKLALSRQLVPDAIEVFLLSLFPDTDLIFDLEVLTPEERLHAERFVQTADRVRFSATRAMVRRLLAARLACAPNDVPIATGLYGKPTVIGPQPCPVFNVSHSGTCALIALADEDQIAMVGIDIERCNPKIDEGEVANIAFTHAERSEIFADVNTHRAFYEHWVAKEAVLKALSLGIEKHLQSIRVRPHSTGVIDVECTHEAWPKVRAASLPAPDGYAAALAWCSTGTEVTSKNEYGDPSFSRVAPSWFLLLRH